jgi:hypothetical protein
MAGRQGRGKEIFLRGRQAGRLARRAESARYVTQLVLWQGCYQTPDGHPLLTSTLGCDGKLRWDFFTQSQARGDIEHHCLVARAVAPTAKSAPWCFAFRRREREPPRSKQTWQSETKKRLTLYCTLLHYPKNGSSAGRGCAFPTRTLRCVERKGQAADGQKIMQNRPH